MSNQTIPFIKSVSFTQDNKRQNQTITVTVVFDDKEEQIQLTNPNPIEQSYNLFGSDCMTFEDYSHPDNKKGKGLDNYKVSYKYNDKTYEFWCTSINTL